MRTGHDRHIGEGQLVTRPEAQLRLMGIPRVTGAEQWLVDKVQIRGIGDLLSYTLRLVRGIGVQLVRGVLAAAARGLTGVPRSQPRAVAAAQEGQAGRLTVKGW